VAVTALIFVFVLLVAALRHVQAGRTMKGDVVEMPGTNFSIAVLALVSPLLVCPAAAAQSPQHKTVLTVQWSSEDFPTNPIVDAAIRRVLSSRSDMLIDHYAEYLESDRFPAAEAAAALRDYIRAKYRGRQIDLVIAISDPALQFVLRHRAQLFPNASVVFTGTTAPPPRVRSEGAGLTGVLSGAAFRETLELALKLHPATERVFVIAQAASPDFLDRVRDALNATARPGVKLVYVNEPSIERLTAAIRKAPPRSFVLYIRYSQESPGEVIFPAAVSRTVAEASPVPVYGAQASYVGQGIVGGAIRSPEALGTRAAQVALQILDGTPAQDIPLENERLVPTFDWRQLRRWHIDAARLPAGSVIQFRDPTVWELYHWYIVGALSLVAFQALLISGLLAQHTRRRRAEEVNRARDVALRTSYERIRQLAGRLINAQEAACTRIAGDLHDDVGQELAGISIAVSNLKRWRRNVQEIATQEALSVLQRRALGLVDRVRRLSHDLHPGTLRHVGLTGALDAYCLEVEQQYGVEVAFTAEGDLRRISDDAALCLFRIAQEAMRNAITHGKARQLRVAAASLECDVQLTVADDGIGFDLEAARRKGAGLGLVTMEERARVVGGEVRLVTRPGNGTTVRARVPGSATGRAQQNVVEEADGDGGRDESSKSLDRRRSQAVRRRYRAASQRPVRDCGDRRRRQPAERSGAAPAPRRRSAGSVDAERRGA
jgi:signal transduction histidine kinase